jgi:hypothetical protein
VKITKQLIVDHLDDVESILVLVAEAIDAKDAPAIDRIGSMVVAGVKSLLGDAPPATQAEVDARRDALRRHFVDEDAKIDAEVHEKFDHSNATPAPATGEGS